MKKLLSSLLICACLATVAFAQDRPATGNQNPQQGAQSAEAAARQQYALDIKNNGIGKAVKNAMKSGVLSVKDMLSLALAQGVKAANILTVMSMNGVKANDIIAAKVEGVSPDMVSKCSAAVEQYKADIAKSDTVDGAIKTALEGGLLSLDNMLEMAVDQGFNPSSVLTSMSNNGVKQTDAAAAAAVLGVTSDTVQLAYNTPGESDTQAYTPAENEGNGNQPNSPADRGQGSANQSANAARPTFSLPVGSAGGGSNGPPEDFTPASPSRPI